MIPASLEHHVILPKAATQPYGTLIALHGRGTNEYDLLPIAESLGIDEVLVASPRAPLRFAQGFPGAYAWYELGEEGMPHPRTFYPSVDRLLKFIEEIKKGYPVDSSRVVLMGFSQGAVMAYAAGLQKPASISGIAALSGYVPYRSGLPLELQNLNGLPVFISHGSFDELIPVQLARESAELLKSRGAEVTFREYLMGHQVETETLMDLAVWMKKRFQ